MSKTLEELRNNAAKGVETCWAVERVSKIRNEFMTWDDDDGNVDISWSDSWDRAIKFYDRASAEMFARYLPEYWDIRILEHQLVFPLPQKDEHR